jgi:hypothetical protein
MLKVGRYDKPISSSFDTAISSTAQKVKPKIIVNWLDSRHLDNLAVTTNDDYSNSSYPNRGFYFQSSEAFNGIERQSFRWAVADVKDKDGDVIKADGTWYAMPSLLTNDISNTQIGGSLEYGWWSNSKSNSSLHITYNGYGFATDPYVEATFSTRKVNKIRIITSEFYGQIYDYTVQAYDDLNNLVLNENGSIRDGRYYQDHIISPALSTQDIAKIRVTIRSTKNPQDYARIQEIIPMYQEDMTSYVMDYSINRTRDIHSTSLPIGGSQISATEIVFDNTTKKFNIFNQSSDFGKYMNKDLKFEIYTGWRIKKPNSSYGEVEYLQTQLIANVNSTSTTMSINDPSIFTSGGVGNYFVAVVDRSTQSEELILCSGTSGTNTLNIVERGYGGTLPKSHAVDAKVEFEIYEFIKNGTFYVDEWNVTSSEMKVTASLQDWSKYLSEKTINFGFFAQNSTVGDAVKNLLMRSNFPSADIKKLSKYSQGALERGAIVGLSFKEDSIDRAGNNIVSSSGLRARFWGMPSSRKDISVKDILADSLDRELSPLDKALGELPFISPSFTALSKDISDNPTSAIELTDYSFTGTDNNLYTDYYNGVFDGYYIPTDDGQQTLVVTIQGGGVRLYLDDALIINRWRMFESNTRLESTTLDLIAGVPRKIRFEFFHAYNNGSSPSFRLKFYKTVGIGSDTLLTASEFCTIAAIDSIGVKNASRTISVVDAFNERNNGVYIDSPKLNQQTGLTSEPKDKSVLLESNSYIRIPTHLSFDITNPNSYLHTGNWTFEFFGKFNNDSFSSDGEYLSSWANGSPSSGFEFFYNATEHGFKIRTLDDATVITETVSSNVALSNSSFYHILATFDGEKLYYYINGDLKDSQTLAGTPIALGSGNITIGGRGASYSAGAEVAPSTIRSFIVDEFHIYNQYLSEEDVENRYSEASIQPLTIFPFLFGNDLSIREILNNITFADLGRLYIDELDYARYEHFYRFFEPSIDQHSNVQASISDSSHIISADYTVQLQCNKVTVPVSNLQTVAIRNQPLWRAPENSTLASVSLSSNLTANANVVFVSTTIDPPFPESGYIKIGSEIIRYLSKTATSFNGLERGQFQTTAAVHQINDGDNSKVRETRYYNVVFDKAPAFNVKTPFITAIDIDEPDQIEIVKYIPFPYGAELILASGSSLPVGQITFIEGTNPLTGYVYATSIVGTPVVVTEQNSQITSQSATIAESIKKYGLKDITIESEFIGDPVHAKKIADFIIEKTQTPVPILNIQTIAMPKLQLGDRIRISNMASLGIVNTDYWVISHSMVFGSSIGHNIVLRQVT